MNERLNGARPFLWVDEDPERAQRVRQEEVLVSPAGRTGAHAVPHGLIHDWCGAIFIPDSTVNRALAVLQDYDRYKEFYKPAVMDSKPLDQTGSDYQYAMLWMQKVLFVTAAVDNTYDSSYVRVNDKRWYSITRSTRVQEIENYGQPDERRLEPGEGKGYLWAVYSIVRLEERDGGVYVDVEAEALSRDIPLALRWVVTPVVDRLSRDSVASSLRKTRQAVCSTIGAQARLAGSH